MNFENNVPFIKKGLEVSQISFSGGRVAASIAHHGGLTHVDYYGRQRLNASTLYKADPISAWGQLFRLCVVVNGELFYLEFNDTQIFPFGYDSRCRVGDVDLRHRLTLINDAMVFQIEVEKNPHRKKVSAKLLLTEAVARVKAPYREWGNFEWDASRNAAMAKVIDTYPAPVASAEDQALTQCDAFGAGDAKRAETLIGITADMSLALERTPPSFPKVYITTRAFTRRLALTIAFGHDAAPFGKRLAVLRRNAPKEVEAVVALFKIQQRQQPHISAGDKTVESLLAMTGGIVQSLKVKDLPGAIRAADSGYWVWGWDSMVHSDAMLLCQDIDGVRDMLEFYRTAAHPKLGIPHAITLAGQPLLAMAFSAQCLYGIMLYNAYVFTGDIQLLREFYPFAKSLALRATAEEVGSSGLIRGVAMFPDFPEHLGQDGHDISVFNNSIFYQALRALEQVATELGVVEDARDFKTRAERLCRNFDKFFDSKTGYFVDSLSSKDWTPRKHYPVYAILWITPFARDLVRGKESRLAKFMNANFTARHGVRMYPTWDACFMKDGNQLGMYMPVIENFHRQMMALAKDSDSISAWRNEVAWFWNQLTVPEALTCEQTNHGVTVDNPGRKQAFGAKAWYSMFFHVQAGLDFDLRGIHLSPADAGKMDIQNLMIRGKTINCQIRGRGWGVGSLTVNGEKMGKANFIPYTSLRKTNFIVLQRSIQ